MVRGLFQGGCSVVGFFWCIWKKEGVGCCTNEQALGTFVLKSAQLYVVSGERAVSV